MLIRYSATEHGEPVKLAEVYTKDEHCIRNKDIDKDALRITGRLRNAGHSAYIVGGAVRDLLIRRKPKDFDVVTDASPDRIRKLFRNSRTIGKRFRLVHVYFNKKLIEVSTFRGINTANYTNVYGSIEEDVKRRDFTINALYYCPYEGHLIDYVGGYSDIRQGKIKAVIPLNKIFTEDPVRIIRAIKYTEMTGFKPGFLLKRAMKKSVDLVAETSSSRLTEELFKILLSGYSGQIIKKLSVYGLLEYILPNIEGLLKDQKESCFNKAFFRSLSLLDREVREHDEERRARCLAFLLADYLFLKSPYGKADRIPFKETLADLKLFIQPITPPNFQLERALSWLIRKRKKYYSGKGLTGAKSSWRERSKKNKNKVASGGKSPS